MIAVQAKKKKYNLCLLPLEMLPTGVKVTAVPNHLILYVVRCLCWLYCLILISPLLMGILLLVCFRDTMILCIILKVGPYGTF